MAAAEDERSGAIKGIEKRDCLVSRDVHQDWGKNEQNPEHDECGRAGAFRDGILQMSGDGPAL